ncbi:PilN domain-containing protein [Deinococcus multiflagellatus]|uniref:PilN domain-containing protein n=1 Tax=Deinococcus multiflagellatus TaxID=1656887 RepID=UPI001CC9BE28|nr:fimbrial assembly protein [Deinococcus multiflagellatus]MBZ9712751.1 fimbrial assembly protein [Deinococcus multiflagellatus]
MVEINLLPQQYRKQAEPNAWIPAAIGVAAITGLALLAGEIATGTRAGELRKQLDALNGDATALAPANAEFVRLTQQKTQLEQVTNVSQQLRSSKTYWTNDLAAFTAQLPQGSGVALQSMSIKALDASALSTLQQTGIYTGKNVTREIDLTGNASSQQAVVNFLRTFENSPNFGVNFRNLQSDASTGRYTFSASVGIVQASAPAPADTPATPGATPAAPSAPAGTTGGNGSVN